MRRALSVKAGGPHLQVLRICALFFVAASSMACTSYCRLALPEYAWQAHSKGRGWNLTTELAVGPAANPERHGRGWALGPVAGYSMKSRDPDAPEEDVWLWYAGMKLHYFLYRIASPIPGRKGEIPELFALGSSLALGPAWAKSRKSDEPTRLRGVISEGELFARLTLLTMMSFKASVGAEWAPEFSGVFARLAIGLAPAVMGRSQEPGGGVDQREGDGD